MDRGKPEHRKVAETLLAVVATALLSACVTTGGSGLGLDSAKPVVGPRPATPTKTAWVAEDRRLDIIVPRFDPGLPEDPDDYEAEGVWPELRRAEARKFALDMKDSLQDTKAFGGIWVTPDTTAMGDLYVLGTIAESNGEDVEIVVEVRDSMDQRWMKKRYSHRVKEAWHRDPRNTGKNPYAPVFEKAAEDIANRVKKRKDEDLERIRAVAEVRFGYSFAEAAFAPYLAWTGEHYRLVGRPAADDPMLRRTNAVRVREQLFLDGMQFQYEVFAGKMADSYAQWQAQSLVEAKAARQNAWAALGKGIVGTALLVGGVVAVVAGATTGDPGDATAAVTAGTAAAIGGAAFLASSGESSATAQMHRSALNELGASLDLEVSTRNVSFEGKTAQLTGTVQEQYRQWREFLKRIHAVEATPQVQL